MRGCIPTDVCKCSSLTDSSSYSQRLCAKLQAKLTVRYAKVYSFGEGQTPTRGSLQLGVSLPDPGYVPLITSKTAHGGYEICHHG